MPGRRKNEETKKCPGRHLPIEEKEKKKRRRKEGKRKEEGKEGKRKAASDRFNAVPLLKKCCHARTYDSG
ncbi:hypothetical protein [Succinimonas sp.]|uniref:hypothetical protein n=1 Tax=Succinimonas sp. TaxID=1936151 RepID=UPI003867EFC6